MFKTIKAAEKVAETLSQPSKMPCFSYSIPAQKCITGMKLRDIKGSVCNSCYALKGRYSFPNVKDALFRRFETLKNPLWVDAMVFMIGKREKSGFFRFFDSGDIQGEWHLTNIVEVAKRLPQIKFWIPTREYGIVSKWLAANGSFPENVTVRLSAYMVEGEAPVELAKRLGLVSSSVSRSGFSCPSSVQEGKCRDCRACWDKNNSNISYKRH